MDVREIVANAKGESVRADTLTDSSEGGIVADSYDPLVSFLDEGEQPHYIFEFSISLAEILDSFSEDYNTGTHRHLMVTDKQVRIISSTMDFAFRYDTINSIGYIKKKENYVVLLNHTGTDSFEFSLSLRNKGMDELKEAIKYIRENSQSER